MGIGTVGVGISVLWWGYEHRTVDTGLGSASYAYIHSPKSSPPRYGTQDTSPSSGGLGALA